MRRLEARSLRDRLAALIIAVAVAMAIAAGGWRVLDAAWAESAPALDGATRLGAEAVGRALSGQIEHALALGIPLDKLVRVEDYLKAVVASAPQVDAVAVLDEAGRPIFATREGIVGLTFPVNGGGQRATLVLSTESPFLNAATVHLEILLGATALLGGLIAFLIASLFLEMHLAPARARLALALGRGARGDFAVAIPTTGRGRTTAAFRALARRIEPVHVAARHLADGVATVRAIDFDGSLSKRLDPLLATVAATRGLADIDPGETTRSTVPSPSAIATRVVLLTSLYAGAWPLVANFAIDRGTDMIPAPWRPVPPLFAEVVAVVLGMLISRHVAPSATRVTAALGTALAGVAFTAVFWCRSYELFIALRVASGFGLGIALTPLLRDPRLTAHPRTLVTLLGLTGLVVGPMFGGLVAEAIGRRGTFALLGIAMLSLAPRAAAMPAPAAQDTAPRLGFAAQAARLLEVLALAALFALAVVIVPSGPGFDNYAVGAGVIVAAGLGVALAPTLLPPVLAGLLVGVAGALWLSPAGIVLPEVWRWPVSSFLLGLGSGSLLKWHAGSLLKQGWPVLFGLALGAVLAPVATIPGFAAMSVMLPLGVLLMGVLMLSSSRRSPG